MSVGFDLGGIDVGGVEILGFDKGLEVAVLGLCFLGLEAVVDVG